MEIVYERENRTLEGAGCCLSCGAVGTWQYFYSQNRDRGGLRRKEKGEGCNDSRSEVDESRIPKGPGSCFEKNFDSNEAKNFDSSKEKNVGSHIPKSFVCRTAKHPICTAKHPICADHAFCRREASSG